MSATLRKRALQAQKLWRVLREPTYRRALRHGVAAAVEHDDIPYQADFRTVIDVGANRGQFALVAMRRFPRAKLWCFEPLPDASAKLRKLVGPRANATVIDMALGARAGTADLHITRHDDSSSLLVIGDRQLAEFPATDEVRSMPVRTARLDELLTRDEIASPALLKIDVQGSEFDVLTGADAILDSFDAILVECSFVELYAGQALASDVIAHLCSLGWLLSGIYNVTYGLDGACLQADPLFHR